MKKAEVNPEIYREWDRMQEQMTKRYQRSMFPAGCMFPMWDEAYPLVAAIDNAPKISTGRNRKRDEELVVVPRFVLKFLTEHALQLIFNRDSAKQEEYKKKKGEEK